MLPRSASDKPLDQAARAHHFNAVGVDLDKNVGSVNKPIAVHDRIGDCLAQGVDRVLRDVLPFEPLDPIGDASIALNETQGVLDVGHDAAVEILAIQDVDLVGAPSQQAGDVGLREETTHASGEKEDTSVAEEQCAARPLGRLCVLTSTSSTCGRPVYAGMTEPNVELLVVEVLRISEPRAG